MNEVFFDELGIPRPDVSLGAGGGTHAEQTAKIMVAYEALCRAQPPSMTVVVGDVNSTLACAVAAKKLGIPVAHIEAGLRSGDMSMPEEINRRVVDTIADLFFVTEPSGLTNLSNEGVRPDRIHYVGNLMIDNLRYQFKKLDADVENHDTVRQVRGQWQRYGVVTLHRPSNVDDPLSLRRILEALETIAARVPLVFPVHPRTRAKIDSLSRTPNPNVVYCPPLPYMPFLALWSRAVLVLTDSGGIQEETTALGVPCLTIRENTERPITVDVGTNVLVGTDPNRIVSTAMQVIDGDAKKGQMPMHWDGAAANRIADVLVRVLDSSSRGKHLQVA
jgi:UDP-N-acetylglucosamine 2-epimerase (non-hydrolysing)